jgi:hypothetical protein
MQLVARTSSLAGRNDFFLERQKCPWHNHANLSRFRQFGVLDASATQFAYTASPCHEKNQDF